MDKPLSEYNSSAYQLLKAYLAKYEGDGRPLKILDIGSGDIRPTHYLRNFLDRSNCEVTCIDINKIDIDQELAAQKNEQLHLLPSQNINAPHINGKLSMPICVTGTRTQTGSPEKQYDLIILHATLHELHSDYDLSGYLSWLFNQLSWLLADGGNVLLGDYYFSDNISRNDQLKYVEAQKKLTGHADPPEYFVPPEILERYAQLFLKRVRKGEAEIFQTIDGVARCKNYYIYAFEKRECPLLPYFSERDRYIIQSGDFNRVCKSALSELLSRTGRYARIASKSSSDGDFRKNAFKCLSEVLWDKDVEVDLLQVISQAAAKYMYGWYMRQPERMPKKFCVWIGYHSLLLDRRMLSPLSPTICDEVKYEQSDYHGYCFDFTRNFLPPLRPEIRDHSFSIYNQLLHPGRVQNAPSLHSWIQTQKGKSLQIINNVGKNVLERDGYFLYKKNKKADWDESLKELHNSYTLDGYSNFLSNVFSENSGYSAMGVLNLKDAYRSRPLGTLMYFSDKEQDAELLEELGRCVSNIFSHLLDMEYELRSAYMNGKSAKSAIMARNMSHNIGSHVLSGFDPQNYQDYELRILNQYLQKRMDMIASVTSGWGAATEDMWFFRDLVGGFVLNNILLDYIVATYGYSVSKRNIVFVVDVEMPDQTRFSKEYRVPDGEKRYKLDADIGADFMVSVPNGVIGAQAFYVILENAIRNSAKYGPSREVGEFKVFINCCFDPDLNAYCVKISDNLTEWRPLKSRDTWLKMQRTIVDGVIKDTGEPITEGLGIAEMAIAAEFLTGDRKDELCFEIKDHKTSGKAKSQLKVIPQLRKNSRDASAREFIEFDFYLQAPRTLLIVGDESIKPEKGLGISVTGDRKDLSRSSVSYKLAYIQKAGNALGGWLLENHWKLPYRVLIPKGMLTESDLKSLPEGRFVIVDPVQFENVVTREDWERTIVEMYEIWISHKWPDDKGKPKPLCARHVMLGFHEDRPFELWVNGVRNLEDWPGHIHLAKADKTEISRYFSNKNTRELTDNPLLIHREIAKCASGMDLILYDRHNDLKAKVKPAGHIIHHPIGKDPQSQRMADILSAPPKGTYLLKMFILSLIESALTRVLIVDERMVEICLNEHGELRHGKKDDSELLPHSIAAYRSHNVLIPFKVVADSGGREEKSVSVSKKAKVVGGELNVCGDWVFNDVARADIIVFHRGTIDILAEKVGPEVWFDGWVKMAPFFIVTSGGGNYVRHLPAKYGKSRNELPFVQISAIKGSLIDDISKYHLVRALTAAKGGC